MPKTSTKHITRPAVISLVRGYQAMADDDAREREAAEWVENLPGGNGNERG